MRQGLVEWVSTDSAQTMLAAAASASDTVLSVENAAVLVGAPQLLLADDSVVDVSAVDVDANTVTVSAIPGSLDVGTPVEVHPARIVKWAGVRLGPDDDFAETVTVRVPHGSQWFRKLADGMFDGADRPVVSITDGDEPELVDVKNAPPEYDASTAPLHTSTEDGEGIIIDGDGLTAYTDDVRLVKSFPVLSSASASDGSTLYTANIRKYDIATGTPVGSVFGSPTPSGVAYDGGFLFGVSEFFPIGRLYKYDPVAETSSAFATGPFKPPVAAGSGWVYVVDDSTLDIRRFDTTTGTEDTTVFPIVGSFGDPMRAVGSWLYVQDGSDIRRFDTTTGTEDTTVFPIVVGFGFAGWDADESRIFVAETSNPPLIHAFDATTGVEDTDQFPLTSLTSVSITTDGRNLFASEGSPTYTCVQWNVGSDFVSLSIDSATGDLTATGLARLADVRANSITLDNDNGWTTLTAASGWTANTGTGAPRVKRVGDTVYYKGGLFGGTASTTATTLPEWARPVANVRVVITDATAAVSRIRILTSGAMQPLSSMHAESQTSWVVA